MEFHVEKERELLMRLASEFVVRESNHKSLITVTQADLSRDGKRSTIFFTVLPDSYSESVEDFLKRKGTDFRNFVKNRAKLRVIPFFDFKIDKGEKVRMLIDEIGKNS